MITITTFTALSHGNPTLRPCENCRVAASSTALQIGPGCSVHLCPKCILELANAVEDHLLSEAAHDCEAAIGDMMGPSWLGSGLRYSGEKIACTCGQIYLHSCAEGNCRWDPITTPGTVVTIEAELPDINDDSSRVGQPLILAEKPPDGPAEELSDGSSDQPVGRSKTETDDESMAASGFEREDNGFSLWDQPDLDD